MDAPDTPPHRAASEPPSADQSTAHDLVEYPPGDLRGDRVLVTGGAGFIGSHIAHALAPHAEVTVYDSLVSGNRSNVPAGAEFVEADVRDGDALERAVDAADVVFHEAAMVSVGQSVEEPTESHDVTAEATLSVLEAARRSEARVVLASSAAIYGQPEATPIPESAAKTPTSPYGLDKLAADHYARLYHDLYGLETVALRYFNVYGPGQTPGEYAGVISVFVEQALAGEPITVEGDGEQTRDFVYVGDVVRANLRAATTDAVGEAYNVATGESISIRRLAERIQELSDADSPIVHRDARPGDIRHSVAETERARDRLGFEPAVSVSDGLARTVEWFRDR
ncbi:NAD-dependent epimerase/dehydratase family protein [Halovivax cerinus]|uniref:NAD-dependent epimerase/dehydratase family protein n=1 Tax=Halovivax cerinus TaxID=1487865 RepID=A0ABD5NRW4_9EURY|nr:NAD-dependent epimerase/dehydratase family protein [Halovivax cerinus]